MPLTLEKEEKTSDARQAFKNVRENLELHLLSKGLNLERPFRCLNPEHEDKHPSMIFNRKRSKCHCFACGADYDIFDLVGIDYGLNNPRDKFSKAFELFSKPESFIPSKLNLSPVNNTGSIANPPPKVELIIHKSGQSDSGEPGDKNNSDQSFDFSSYFRESHERLCETKYLQQRGISPQTARQFTLGFDPYYKTGYDSGWPALIIPTGPGSLTARNTRPDPDKDNRIRKKGPNPIFNSSALQESKQPVFVVEGEIDALSFAELGFEAVALGSTSNAAKLLSLIKEKKPLQPLILALDNDLTGRKAMQKLSEDLTGLDIEFWTYDPNKLYCGYKDANEALVKNRQAFAKAAELALRLEKESKKSELESYLGTSNAAYLNQFLDSVDASSEMPLISTGFSLLDKSLDGGLYEGLYVVGAISSIGKTSFVTQLVDFAAQNGSYALVFSLEMSRNELIAKSLSRITLEECLKMGKGTDWAKTSRGISDGRRYFGYSLGERQLIDKAASDYEAYASNIFVSELGDISMIGESVKKHVDVLGGRPLVIVDYLQILPSEIPYASDKQTVDRNVLALKRISREFKIPIIAISSFNRANYSQSAAMEAFKESGAVEYSSDVLIALQFKGTGDRSFDVTAEKRKNPRQIELVVLKNRSGVSGIKISFEYYPMFNYFKEVSVV